METEAFAMHSERIPPKAGTQHDEARAVVV